MADVRIKTAAAPAVQRIPVTGTGNVQVASTPYLLTDGRTLVDPFPVEVVAGATSLRPGGALLPAVPPAELGPGNPPGLLLRGSGAATASTVTVNGAAEGMLLVGVCMKGSATAPVLDPGVGAVSIGSWSSLATSCLAFYKRCESDTPAFGNHTGATRANYFLFDLDPRDGDPIGAVERLATAAALTFDWPALTLEKSQRYVISCAQRHANEAIIVRPDAAPAILATGIGTRYAVAMSAKDMTPFPAAQTTQLVSGYGQVLSIEVGI